MDASFNPVTFNSGNAVNSSVNSIVIQSDGKIIAGGAFYSFFNNPARNRITRLNSDGSLDATFTPGTGFNNTVSSLTIQADGKIIVGGDFTSFNGTSRNRIARINIDGSLDATFNPGIGFYNNNTYTDIYAIIFQLDGKIIVGGVFTSYNGTPINNIARINSDGSLDVTFNPMPGFDGDVYATAIQPDGKIIVGGEFNFFNGVA